MQQINGATNLVLLGGLAIFGWWLVESIINPGIDFFNKVKDDVVETGKEVGKGYVEAGDFGSMNFWQSKVKVNDTGHVEVEKPTVPETIGLGVAMATNPYDLGKSVSNSIDLAGASPVSHEIKGVMGVPNAVLVRKTVAEDDLSSFLSVARAAMGGGFIGNVSGTSL